MQAVLQSNDPVLLSWAESLLRDSGFHAVLFDHNVSIMEGSIGAIPRRLMVADDEIGPARELLGGAGIDVGD